MPATIRELKASLSSVLSRAQGGEIIEITSHNKPIARIIGIPRHAEAGLRGLIANGTLSWSGGKPRSRAPWRCRRAEHWSARWCWRTGVDPVLRHIGAGQAVHQGRLQRRDAGAGPLGLRHRRMPRRLGGNHGGTIAPRARKPERHRSNRDRPRALAHRLAPLCHRRSHSGAGGVGR